jgi:hypothetical protein
MSFQTAQKIKEVLDHVHRRSYLLPGIQREFVWKPEQIVRLFDSLLRGYPIGSFLFWRVQPEHKHHYTFYEFIRDYHERERRRNPKATLAGDGGVTAILDGQQRLTSLYVGLMGSYAARPRYARHDSSYPAQRLYLNLAQPSTDPELAYDLAFRADDAVFRRDGNKAWFRVGHILDFQSLHAVFQFLIKHELTSGTNEYPLQCLSNLYDSVMERGTISHYLEDQQDLDRVLNIFIRVNSGGTVLSYSDLLLSIATAQWQQRDAREEIYGLVDEINGTGDGFRFGKDFVLKCCLVLAELDIRWKVENFTAANMAKIESGWTDIAKAIRATVQLLGSFGYAGDTLVSANAVIPVVYYLFKRGVPAGYVDRGTYAADRETIRRWLAVVQLKGVFSGVPDNVLKPIRDVVREHHTEFPVDRIADVVRAGGRSTRFEPGEVEELLDYKYGGPYTFAVLALLHPNLDFRQKFHQDHVHPRSHFSAAQLARRGIPATERDDYVDAADRIGNLQLLEGPPNMEKSSEEFAKWLAKTYPGSAKRQAYMDRNHIPDVGLAFSDFLEFYEERRKLLLAALYAVLDVYPESRTNDAQKATPVAITG